MGGYSPNPAAAGLVKIGIYALFAKALEIRSVRRIHPVFFGALRVLAGWIVGVPLYMLALSVGGGPTGTIVLYAPIRFAVWWLMIDRFFTVRGGTRGLLISAALGTVLSTALDSMLWMFYQDVPFLRMGWC